MASYQPQYCGLGTPRPRIGSLVHRPDVSLVLQAVAVARSDDANHGSTLSFWWSDPLAHGWARMMREREIGKGGFTGLMGLTIVASYSSVLPGQSRLYRYEWIYWCFVCSIKSSGLFGCIHRCMFISCGVMAEQLGSIRRDAFREKKVKHSPHGATVG
jgi:hypothetical protein